MKRWPGPVMLGQVRLSLVWFGLVLTLMPKNQ
jgi:hypothetical protein